MVMEDFSSCCEQRIKTMKEEYKDIDSQFKVHHQNEIRFGKEIRKLKEKNNKLNEKNYNLERQLKFEKDNKPFNILKNSKKMKKIEKNLIYKLKNGNKFLNLKFEINEKLFLEDLSKHKEMEKITKASERIREKNNFFDLLYE